VYDKRHGVLTEKARYRRRFTAHNSPTLILPKRRLVTRWEILSILVYPEKCWSKCRLIIEVVTSKPQIPPEMA